MLIKDELEFIADGMIIYRLFFKEVFTSKHVVIITDISSGHQLYVTEVEGISVDSIQGQLNYYYVLSNDIKSINVSIVKGESVVLEKRIDIDYEYLIRPTILIERGVGFAGMGDYFWSLPTIKKLSISLDKKIDIITRHPQILINNPYVGDVYKIEDWENVVDLYTKYNLRYKKCFFELIPGHENAELNKQAKYLHDVFVVDLRQTMAFNCGFHLTPDELNVEFYPDVYVPIDLPDNYVLINPYIAGIDRDIGKSKWQEVVDILNDNNINVVSIGLSGRYHELNIRLGKNLCGLDCQNNLSQTWHIINKSKCFLTFDTGIYILGGTTETQIFLIDTYLESHWHTPYRNGIYNYKHNVIRGNCKEYCLSNLKYCNIIDGIIHQHPVQTCGLHYSEFKCIPSVEMISNSIINYCKVN